MRAVCLRLKFGKYWGFSETFRFGKFDAKNAILNDVNEGDIFGFIQISKIDKIDRNNKNFTIHCKRYQVGSNGNSRDYIPFNIVQTSNNSDWWEVSVALSDITGARRKYGAYATNVSLADAYADDLCEDRIKSNDKYLSSIYEHILNEVYVFKTGAKLFSPIVSCKYINEGQGFNKYYVIEMEDLVDWDKLYKIETNEDIEYEKYYYNGFKRIKIKIKGNGKELEAWVQPLSNGNTRVLVFDDNERTIKNALKNSKQPIALKNLVD